MPRSIATKDVIYQLVFIVACVGLLIAYTHWSDLQLLIDGHMGHP